MDIGTISFLSYLAAFGGGLALSFTPCVYPLVPVVIAVIGASGEISRRRSFFLSLVYVFGMAVTFSMLGVFAALTGSLFGSLASSPVVNLLAGSIIMLFGLSVLGVFDLPLLSFRGARPGRMPRGGRMIPAFTMGLLSGFIGVPCVAPVLGSILLFIASTGSVAVGFSLLFVFAVGLGALLLLAGVFTGLARSFAKAERVMLAAQKVLGAGLIILAQYFIFRAGQYAVNGWF